MAEETKPLHEVMGGLMNEYDCSELLQCMAGCCIKAAEANKESDYRQIEWQERWYREARVLLQCAERLVQIGG